jgi:conjugal transfer pilus assembly protein TrbC
MRIGKHWIVSAALSCCACVAWAQAALPSDFDIRQAQQRMREAFGSDGSQPGNLPSLPVVPRIERLPMPQARQSDIGQIAESFRSLPISKPASSDRGPELMVFVSFSIPRPSLERIVAESERTGAVLVLRGLKGNSLTRMGEEVAQLIGKRQVTAIIHPPAFTQFKVTQVPALVLANASQATRIGTDGCASPSSFVKVDGDVSQGFALDLIERQAPAWSEVARRFASKLEERRP